MKSRRSLLVIAVALIIFVSSVALAQQKARVHYINVGQADSILLEFDKTVVLIDAGGDMTGSHQRYDLINYLISFFNSRPELNKTIDTIIISHPQQTHFGMLPAVLQRFDVKNLIDGGENTGSGIELLRGARTWVKAHGGHYFTVTAADTKMSTFSNPALAAIQAVSNILCK